MQVVDRVAHGRDARCGPSAPPVARLRDDGAARVSRLGQVAQLGTGLGLALGAGSRGPIGSRSTSWATPCSAWLAWTSRPRCAASSRSSRSCSTTASWAATWSGCGRCRALCLSIRLGGRYAMWRRAGGYGERVDRPAELRPALQRCIASVAAGRAALCEVATHEEDATALPWTMAPDAIPPAVRARDLVGYGPRPPGIAWPAARASHQPRARVRGRSEYSVAWGDDRATARRVRRPGRPAASARSGTEAHYEYGAAPVAAARIFHAAGAVTVSAAAVALELNPAVAEWMRERDHALLGHGWRWTDAWTYTREQERALARARDRDVRRVLGSRRSAGTRAAGRARHARILHELGGFLYHSESCADDLPVLRDRRRTPPILVIPIRRPTTTRATSEPGLREPARIPRHDGPGASTSCAGGRRAADDDDRRGARALERPGRPRVRAAAVHRARAVARRRSFMRRCDIASRWLEHCRRGEGRLRGRGCDCRAPPSACSPSSPASGRRRVRRRREARGRDCAAHGRAAFAGWEAMLATADLDALSCARRPCTTPRPPSRPSSAASR